MIPASILLKDWWACCHASETREILGGDAKPDKIICPHHLSIKQENQKKHSIELQALRLQQKKRNIRQEHKITHVKTNQQTWHMSKAHNKSTSCFFAFLLLILSSFQPNSCSYFQTSKIEWYFFSCSKIPWHWGCSHSTRSCRAQQNSALSNPKDSFFNVYINCVHSGMQSQNSKLRHWRAAAELWLWKKGCVVLGPHFSKSRIQGLNHHDWGLRCVNYSKTITVKNQECLKQTNDISISESCCRTTLMTGWQQSWQNTNHWTLSDQRELSDCRDFCNVCMWTIHYKSVALQTVSDIV